MSTSPLFLEMVGRSQVSFTSSTDLLAESKEGTVNRRPETSPMGSLLIEDYEFQFKTTVA